MATITQLSQLDLNGTYADYIESPSFPKLSIEFGEVIALGEQAQ